MGSSIQEASDETHLLANFSCLQFGPRIRTEGLIVVLDKKKKKKSLFGAVLSGITSSYSTPAKPKATRGRLDLFFLEIIFL